MVTGIRKLSKIANKKRRVIIGLMSGTSLDGLDIAVCDVEGNGRKTTISLRKFETVPYDEVTVRDIRTVFARPDAPLEMVCRLHKSIALTHALMIRSCLQKWNLKAGDVDLIASHGQTVFHSPKPPGDDPGSTTLQLGDGDHLAHELGIITVSDFRQKHIAGGGQGAPLAAYGDYLLFSRKKKNIVLLNIGGIANFTFIPAGGTFNDIVCMDTGPGNVLMDAWTRLRFPGKRFDNNGEIASRGNVNEGLLNSLLSHPYFLEHNYKTTGPETFNMEYIQASIQRSGVKDLSHEDILATLTYFTAETIARSLKHVTGTIKGCSVICSGGGSHNLTLLKFLTSLLFGYKVTPAKDEFDPDAKEAMLFALLANELVAGNEKTFATNNPNFPNISMGKISFPW